MKTTPDKKKQSIVALKKAQTHINKIIKMIEEDAYCIDVLQQTLAVNGLLKSASNNILENHLQTCFASNIGSPNKKVREKLISEVIDVVNLSNKAK